MTDADWLFGGDPAQIVQTVTNGRNGMMPPFGAAIGGEPGIASVTEYTLSLSGREHDAEQAKEGARHFATICAVCHGPSGEGNPAMGSPNLTDSVWLHGGRRDDIQHAIRVGLANQMPAHSNFLSAEQIHLVSLYVYSLSRAPDRE